MSKSKKITKETMLLEPLPLFDCMYCAKEHQVVYKKISEKILTKKYDKMSKSNNNDKTGRYS